MSWFEKRLSDRELGDFARLYGGSATANLLGGADASLGRRAFDYTVADRHFHDSSFSAYVAASENRSWSPGRFISPGEAERLNTSLPAGSPEIALWAAAIVGVGKDATAAAGEQRADIAPVDVGSGGGGTGAASAAQGARLNAQLSAEQIAGGHAFDKHIGEFGDFGIMTREQFAGHIEDVINNSTELKSLSGGRTAYWDPSSGTVVIRNPSAADGGTAFIPSDGKAYYDGLK